MPLIHFQDTTYGQSYIVSAHDLVRAFDFNKQLVPLRHRDGTKLADDGESLAQGRATCLDLSYVPLSARKEAEATVYDELPEMCVAVLQPQDVLIGIRRDERGYYQMYDGTITGAAARLVADRLNKALKVTPRQREAMLIGSMMGWSCPGARPSCDLNAKARPYGEEVGHEG